MLTLWLLWVYFSNVSFSHHLVACSSCYSPHVLTPYVSMCLLEKTQCVVFCLLYNNFQSSKFAKWVFCINFTIRVLKCFCNVRNQSSRFKDCIAQPQFNRVFGKASTGAPESGPNLAGSFNEMQCKLERVATFCLFLWGCRFKDPNLTA